MSLARFNFTRALAFLTWSFAAWTISVSLLGYLSFFYLHSRLLFYFTITYSTNSSRNCAVNGFFLLLHGTIKNAFIKLTFCFPSVLQKNQFHDTLTRKIFWRWVLLRNLIPKPRSLSNDINLSTSAHMPALLIPQTHFLYLHKKRSHSKKWQKTSSAVYVCLWSQF